MINETNILTIDKKKHIFISYSHKENSKWIDELDTKLKSLQRFYPIELWYDRKIEIGDMWESKLIDNLENADIVICLLSDDFTASDYIYNKELPIILKNAKNKKTRVVSLFVKPFSLFKESGLSNYQAVNTSENALISCKENEEENLLNKWMEQLKTFLK